MSETIDPVQEIIDELKRHAPKSVSIDIYTWQLEGTMGRPKGKGGPLFSGKQVAQRHRMHARHLSVGGEGRHALHVRRMGSHGEAWARHGAKVMETPEPCRCGNVDPHLLRRLALRRGAE